RCTGSFGARNALSFSLHENQYAIKSNLLLSLTCLCESVIDTKRNPPGFLWSATTDLPVRERADVLEHDGDELPAVEPVLLYQGAEHPRVHVRLLQHQAMNGRVVQAQRLCGARLERKEGEV